MYQTNKNSNKQGNMKTKPKLRIAVLGSVFVGKSALVHQLLFREFLDSYTKTTSDFHTRPVGTAGLDLELVDSGHMDCENLRRLAIDKCDAFVLVFSLSDKSSYDFVMHVRRELVQRKGPRVPYILVGNKADLGKRCVPLALADCLCTFDWETVYCEVSAKRHQDVDNAFKSLFSLPKFHQVFEAKVNCFSKTEQSKRRDRKPRLSRTVANIDLSVLLTMDIEDNESERGKGLRKFLCF